MNSAIRSACTISLSESINSQLSSINPALARITYTAGYVLPGTDPAPGQTPLPADLNTPASSNAPPGS